MIERLVVRQQDALISNRYGIRPVAADGVEGEPLAIADQKVMTLHRQVTFFADAERTEPVFGFKAREAIETYTVYDITGADGEPIGWFKKEFRPSITRSTWHLEVPSIGLVATGVERNRPVAIVRRAWNLVLRDYMRAPLRFHFDFRTDEGRVVLTSDRRGTWRDVYDVRLPELADGTRLDWRVGAAMGVALDTLEYR